MMLETPLPLWFVIVLIVGQWGLAVGLLRLLGKK